MDNFTKIKETDARFDVSLIILSVEKPEKSALKSIGSSFFNNMILTFFKLITTTNLILLGHLLYEQKVHYQLFMTFQIGVFILEFLGKYFIIGLLKYIFGDRKDTKSLYEIYIRMKTTFIFLIPLIIIPFSICSYYIIDLIYEFALEIGNKSLIGEVYKRFLIFTPIIYFFEILFLLNLNFLYVLNKIRMVFMCIVCYLICHITLSWMLLYILNFGLFGLTISYCFNSLIYFFFTNRFIYNKVKEDANDYFYLIPNKNNFDFEIINSLKRIGFYSLINLGDIFPTQFLFLVSLFIGKNQLIVNIIYLNFFELLTELNRGFHYTIKKDIFLKFQDTLERQKNIIFFSIYFSIIILSIFIILLLFKNILLNIYIYNGGEPIFQKIAENLKIIYPLCIISMSAKLILNGIIRGMELPVSNKRRFVYMIICIFFCYIFCFLYDFGIIGLWISLLILEILHVVENFAKTRKYFPFSHAG